MKILTLLAIFTSLAGSAHADVSDSGNLTIGGQGIIAGTMTVQGNAFGVGGSTFAVLAGTVNVGGLLKISAAGIQWNDGKVSTTSSSGGGAVLASTFTTNFPGASGTNTTFSAPVVGSTVTLTIAGTKVFCAFTGNCYLGALGEIMYWAMSVDNGFAPGFTNSRSMGSSYSSTVNALLGCSHSFLFTELSPGSHTFGVMFKSLGSTWNLGSPASGYGNSMACMEVQ